MDAAGGVSAALPSGAVAGSALAIEADAMMTARMIAARDISVFSLSCPAYQERACRQQLVEGDVVIPAGVEPALPT